MNHTDSAYGPRPRQWSIAAEGHPFIIASVLAAIFLWLVGLESFSILAFGLAAFIVYFFRNPERVAPADERAVIAPADGRVLFVRENVIAPRTGERSTQIAVFMSIFNVHINRFPVAAKVKEVFYSKGKFIVASLDNASDVNEQNGLVLEDEQGKKFVMVQIAGLIARRIVCYVKEGDFLPRGERFGLIRFGSRVDIYVPPEYKANVAVNQKVRSGETIIAAL